MATGTVKWFNDAKGFGFITPMKAAKICSLTSRLFNRMASSPEGKPTRFLRSDHRPEGQASFEHRSGCLSFSS
jgi:hypothetical protein